MRVLHSRLSERLSAGGVTTPAAIVGRWSETHCRVSCAIDKATLLDPAKHVTTSLWANRGGGWKQLSRTTVKGSAQRDRIMPGIGTLASAVSPSDTEIVLTRPPRPGIDRWDVGQTLIVSPQSHGSQQWMVSEAMTVLQAVGATLTVQRAASGTTAQSHAAGSVVIVTNPLDLSRPFPWRNNKANWAIDAGIATRIHYGTAAPLPPEGSQIRAQVLPYTQVRPTDPVQPDTGVVASILFEAF